MTVKSQLEPLLKLSFFFALIPKYDVSSINWWRIKSWFSFIFFVCVIAFCNYKLLPCLMTKRGSFMVLFILIHVVNNVFYLSNFIRMMRLDVGFHNFLQTFDSVDDGILKLMGVKVKHRGFVVLYIGFIMVIFVLQLIGNYFTWLEEAYLYKYMLYHQVQMFFDAIITILQYNFLKNIGIRFKSLTEALQTLLPVPMQNTIIMQVEVLTDLHGNIADIIDFFNYFFGWHILYKQIIVTLNILEMVELVVINELTNWYSLIFTLTASLYAYVQTFVLITMYENIRAEAVTANTLTLRALHRHSSDRLISRKLAILVQQIGTRMPQFTAAGYFNVDYNMIFSFINITMMYVIVLIQSTK